MMTRRCLSRTVLAALFLAGTVAADPLDDLLDKVHAARGGLDNLHAVRTARFRGTFETVGVMEVPIVIEWKRPGRVRIDFTTPQGDGVQATDGQTAWMVMPGMPAPQVLNGEEAARIRRQADMIEGPLVDWKAKGHQLTYLGPGELEGKPVHKLELVQDGQKQVVFIDAATYLPVHQTGTAVVQGAPTEVETVIGDHAPVGKVILARSVKTELLDMGVTQNLTLSTVELDVPIADDRFAMPAAAPPAPAPAPGN